MSESPKYYWLKLMDNFFLDKRIKIMRKNAGEVATAIYLKMLLRAMGNNGIIYFDGYLENFYEELAFDLDEDEEECRLCLDVIERLGLVEIKDSKTYFFPQAIECTGSETGAAERMRKNRKNKAEQERNSSVTDLNNVQKCYIEKEKEIEIDKEIEIELEKETEKESEIYSFTEEGEKAKIMLMLQNGEYYPVFSSEIKKWKELYPNVDIEQQLRTIKGWLEYNPDKRKEKQNMPGYINAWLARKQEEADKQAKEAANANAKKPYTPDPTASYDLERAIKKMNTTVPKLAPKKKKSPS